MNQDMQIQGQCRLDTDQRKGCLQTINGSYDRLRLSENIDRQNLRTLCSDEYLRSYSYLQFSLFPELFPLYLNKLTLIELKSLLKSYVSILLEFFPQSAIYQKYHQHNLAQEILQKYKCDSNQQIQSEVVKLQSLIKRNQPSCHEDSTSVQFLQDSIQILKSFDTKDQTHEKISRQIQARPLTLSLLGLVGEIMQLTIEKGGSYLLYDWTIPSYVYKLALRNIALKKQELIRFQKQDNTRAENRNAKVLKEILRLQIIPFQLELNNFYQHIRNMKTKQFYLMKVQGLLKNQKIQWYYRLLSLLKDLSSLFLDQETYFMQDQIGESSGNSSFQNKKIAEIVKFIDQNIKFPQNQQDQPSNEINQSFHSRINLKQNMPVALKSNRALNGMHQNLKDLQNENVEKISKILVQIQNSNSLQSRHKIVVELQKNQPSKIQVQLGEQIKEEYECGNYYKNQFSRLSQEFLIEYHSLIAITGGSHSFPQSIRSVEGEQLQNLSPQFYSTLQRISKLCERNNNSLQKILNLCSPQSGKTMQKIHEADLESYLILEKINIMLEQHEINPLISGKSQLRQMCSKMHKLKNSIYVNLLSIKIIKSAFAEIAKNQPFQIPDRTLLTINGMEDIIQLFEEIFGCVAQINKNYLPSNQAKPAQIKTYPSLKNVLFLFSSIQLWFQLSVKGQQQMISAQGKDLMAQEKSKHQITLIQQFFESVIQKYSHQEVKIEPQQIVYVNYIILMCQIFKDMRTEEHKSSQWQKYKFQGNKIESLPKANLVNSRFDKFIELTDNGSQKDLQFLNIINLNTNIQRYLESISVRLLAYCFPSIQQKSFQRGDQNHGQNQSTHNETKFNKFNHELCRIPFWKSVLYRNKEIDSQTFVQYFCQNILEKQYQIDKFSSMNSPQYQNLQKTINIDNQNNFTDSKLSYQKTNPKIKESMCLLMKLFGIFKRKYLKLLKLKIEVTAGRINHLQTWPDVSAQSFVFLLQLIQRLGQNFIRFNQNQIQFQKISQQNILQLFSQPYGTQFRHFRDRITEDLMSTLQSFDLKILRRKISLFKPSPQQILQYLQRQKKEVSQENKQKYSQKIKFTQEFYQTTIQFSMLALSYLFWMKCETQIMIDLTANREGSKDLHFSDDSGPLTNMNPSDCASLSLLRWITLLSLICGDEISFNFQEIENYLQSKVQNQNSAEKQETNLKGYRFPNISLLNQVVEEELHIMHNNQFLEFVYEYFPFEVQCEKDQLKLFEKSVQLSTNEQNHQFLGVQKSQKIRFLKISHYVKLLRDNICK